MNNGNNWLSPGSIIGIVGLLAAGGATYSQFNGRMSVAENQATGLEKRLDNLDRKIDFIVNRMIERGDK
jgi:hypothetical protein